MDLNGKNIFITTAGALGDMIVYTPALRCLKETYPDVHITFMTKYGNHEVLEGLPYIDKLTYIIRGKLFGRYRVLPDLWKQDVAVFTDWQPQLLFFAKHFHIPVRAGIARTGHKLSRYLTKPMQDNVYQTTQYVGRSKADFIGQALDITLSGNMDDLDIARPKQSVINKVKRKLESIGIRGQYVFLSPFASQKTRDWQSEDAKKFIQSIQEEYQLPVVISAVSARRQDAEAIGKHILTNLTTMELVALIQGAELCVTPDSGPMHVAGAIGTPCVALFTKDLPSRWALRHNCMPIYLKEPCSPCDDETARICKTLKCMRGITAELVMENVRKILHS